jgi:hypothetical protein
MNEFAIVEIANRHVSDGQIKVNIKEATTTFIAFTFSFILASLIRPLLLCLDYSMLRKSMRILIGQK